MRNELDNLIRNMMSMTPLQRITMARIVKTRIERYAMKMGLDKEKAENYLIYYFRLFVAADADCDYLERDLVNRAFKTNFSDIRFKKLVGEAYDEAFVKKTATVTQKMP
jgi:ABC-type dipeptide/oligopeptide/nickel transport system permease component